MATVGCGRISKNYFGSIERYADNFTCTLKTIITGGIFSQGSEVPIDFVEKDYLPFLLVQFLSFPTTVSTSTLKGAKCIIFNGRSHLTDRDHFIKRVSDLILSCIVGLLFFPVMFMLLF